MATLTVTEKEHWKTRITQRIAKKIESLVASETQFFERIGREARQRALLSLGLAQLQEEQDQTERQKALLEERETQIVREMLAKIRGLPISAIGEVVYYAPSFSEVEKAISKRQKVHEEELLSETEIGRQIVKLRADEASVLDAVWLASSPKHLKSLWEKVSHVLGEEHSRLIADALTIEAE